MKKHLNAVLFAALVSACVPKSDLDQANAENDQLKKEVAALQAQMAQLQSQLSATRQEAEEASALAAKKPPMPVKVTFRKAFTCDSYVATFNTTIKEDFPVSVTIKSHALGKAKDFTLGLSQRFPKELGCQEGAIISNGDEITVENASYEALHLTFNE